MGQQSSRSWKRKNVVGVSLGWPSKRVARKFTWPQDWFATSKSRNDVYKMASKLRGSRSSLNDGDIACMVYVGALLAALKAHNCNVYSRLLSRRVLYLARQLASKKVTWRKSIDLLFDDANNFPRGLKGGNKYLGFTLASSLRHVVFGMFSIISNHLVSSHSKVDGHGFLDEDHAVQQAWDLVQTSTEYKVANNKPTKNVLLNGFRGKGVVVAVIDGGFDTDHTDLSKHFWHNSREIPGDNIDNDHNVYVDDMLGWNYVGNTSVVRALPHAGPTEDHGTHVVGTIVAHNPDKGVFGMAYDAEIMALKVILKEGVDPPVARIPVFERVALAIMYAVDQGAHIINLSIGTLYDERIEKALEYAYRKNVVVVVAAGNDAQSSPTYPASSPFVLAVGNAQDSSGHLDPMSDWAGNKTDYITAPGVNIWSTIHNDSYGYKSGTSMAAPYVSGVVARMLSANPDLSRSQVIDILASSSSYPRTPRPAQSLASSSSDPRTPQPAQSLVSASDVRISDSYDEQYTPRSVVVTALGLAGFAALCALVQTKETVHAKNGKRLVM